MTIIVVVIRITYRIKKIGNGAYFDLKKEKKFGFFFKNSIFLFLIALIWLSMRRMSRFPSSFSATFDAKKSKLAFRLFSIIEPKPEKKRVVSSSTSIVSIDI